MKFYLQLIPVGGLVILSLLVYSIPEDIYNLNDTKLDHLKIEHYQELVVIRKDIFVMKKEGTPEQLAVAYQVESGFWHDVLNTVFLQTKRLEYVYTKKQRKIFAELRDEALDMVLKTAPKNFDNYIIQAQFYFRHKNYIKANKILEKAYELFPFLFSAPLQNASTQAISDKERKENMQLLQNTRARANIQLKVHQILEPIILACQKMFRTG